jgi:hypothetical protein
MCTWDFAQLFDHERDGVLGLLHHDGLEEVLEQVVYPVVVEVLFNLLLVLQLALPIHTVYI